MFDGIAVGDFAVFIQIKQRLVKGLHADVARFGHDVFDAVDFAVEDKLGNGWGVEQDFHGGGAAEYFDGRGGAD